MSGGSAAALPAGGQDARVDRRRRWPLLVGLGALALVGPLVAILSTPHYTPLYDSADYVRHAQSIAHGHGYPPATSLEAPGGGSTAFRPPVYPFLLAVPFRLFGASFPAARIFTALFGVVVVLLVYEIALCIWDRRTALVAGVLCALFPPLIALNSGFFSEPVFLVFELAAVLVVVRFTERPRGFWAPMLAGVLCGLAALTRGNGLLLVPLVALATALIGGSRRQKALRAAAVLAAAILVITPWTIRNAVVFHRFVPVTTETGFTMIQLFNPQAAADDAQNQFWLPGLRRIFRNRSLNEAAIDARLTARAVGFASGHPAYAVKAVAINTLRTLSLWSGRYTGFFSYGGNGLSWSAPFRALVDLAIYPVYLLAALALLVRLRGRQAPRIPLVFWLVPLVLVVASGAAAGASRYRAPADPFFLMLAAAGAAALTGGLGVRRFGAGRSPGPGERNQQVAAAA